MKIILLVLIIGNFNVHSHPTQNLSILSPMLSSSNPWFYEVGLNTNYLPETFAQYFAEDIYDTQDMAKRISTSCGQTSNLLSRVILGEENEVFLKNFFQWQAEYKLGKITSSKKDLSLGVGIKPLLQRISNFSSPQWYQLSFLNPNAQQSTFGHTFNIEILPRKNIGERPIGHIHQSFFGYYNLSQWVHDSRSKQQDISTSLQNINDILELENASDVTSQLFRLFTKPKSNNLIGKNTLDLVWSAHNLSENNYQNVWDFKLSCERNFNALLDILDRPQSFQTYMGLVSSRNLLNCLPSKDYCQNCL